MQTLTKNLNTWTTTDLLEEVVRRSASDGPALHLLETVIIRARLAESDRRFADFGTQDQLAPLLARAGVRGTMEMGLADGED